MLPSARWIVTGTSIRGVIVSIPVMSIVSVPSSFSDNRVMPGGKVSGRTPMPTRFERWIRSKLSTMTALIPSSIVPFAAQSRDEPMPYSLPPNTTSGTPSCLYSIAAS